MDFTYLDYFNYYLKEFCNELINNFPETQVPLLSNYRSLLEGKDDKNDFYAKCFYTKINNYLAPIAKKEVELFQSPGKIFIEGVDLHSVWNNSSCTEVHHTAIWKYLQILMILGRKIIPNHQEIVTMLQKVSAGEVNIPAKVEKTLTTEGKDESEETPSVFGLGDIASSLGSLGSLASGLGLGNLTAGLTGAGGEGAAGLGNLVSGITQMFSNPEFTNAMSQLSQTMGQAMQQQGSDGANSTNEEGASAEGTNCPPMDEKGEAGEAGAAAANTGDATNGGASAGSGLFGNPLFGELAKELTETFNFEDMEKQGKPANIGEALGKFMSGDNPAKLMGLVGKFGSKLQQEVQRGGINPAELLQQTMGALGGQGGAGAGMANMMQQMAQNPQVRQAARQQATRDRLKAKLDAKKNQQQ
jgi:hypothetical protein